jgi:hypothetical protein
VIEVIEDFVFGAGGIGFDEIKTGCFALHHSDNATCEISSFDTKADIIDSGIN